jgi:GTP-binding protein HflX
MDPHVNETDAHEARPGEASTLETSTLETPATDGTRPRLERVVLIASYSGAEAEAVESLDELEALTHSAGAQVLDRVLQHRSHPDPNTYFGPGKSQDLARIVSELGADTVVADSELSPSQRRDLEDIVGVKVIDRTAVILDIFSQHATSREGKAEVELARLQYLLPRLRGWGQSMSRQAGGQVGSGGAGMGSRGPGETRLELDRRRIHARMARLRKQISNFRVTRNAKRSSRVRNRVPSIAIVGYTNAGKSSLLNRLTEADALVEDALFATLDPTVRKAQTVDGRPFTLTDTVGFIRHLPHQLVEAFRSTLEEIAMADALVHVVEAPHSDVAAQLATVRDVLGELGVRDLPEIVVFAKADLIDDARRAELSYLEPHAILVSTVTGEGIPELLERIAAVVPAPEVEMTLLVPYESGDIISRLHVGGRVLATDYREDGTLVTALVHPHEVDALRPLRAPAELDAADGTRVGVAGTTTQSTIDEG